MIHPAYGGTGPVPSVPSVPVHTGAVSYSVWGNVQLWIATHAPTDFYIMAGLAALVLILLGVTLAVAWRRG